MIKEGLHLYKEACRNGGWKMEYVLYGAVNLADKAVKVFDKRNGK